MTSREVKDYLAAIGKKGGQATVATKGFGSLSAEERKAIAKKAASARWSKMKKKTASASASVRNTPAKRKKAGKS
jgi:hypothetical protein